MFSNFYILNFAVLHFAVKKYASNWEHLAIFWKTSEDVLGDRKGTPLLFVTRFDGVVHQKCF